MARIFLVAMSVLCLGVLLLLGTSGFWLPRAAPWLLGWVEVHVDSAGRGEGGELVLRKVRYESPAVDLSLSEFRSPMPLSLLWNGLWRSPADAGEIRLDGLEVRWFESAEESEVETPAPGPLVIFNEVDRWLALADRWLPPLAVENLSLIPPEEQSPFVLPAVTLRSRELELTTKAHGNLPALRMNTVFAADGPWRLQAEAAAWDVSLRGNLVQEATGPRLHGEMDRLSGSGSFFLEWDEDVWTPSKGGLSVANLEIPEGMGGLPADLGSVAVDSLEADWDGSGYVLEGHIRGGQVGEDLTLDLALGGNFEEVVVRAFSVTGSWAHLVLGKPVRLDLKTLEPEAPFQFSASANLAEQQYYPAQGELTGSLEADLGPGGSYPVQFSLEGSDLQADGRSLRSLELKGNFDFPHLVVESLRVTLAEGSAAVVEGSANLEDGTVSLRTQADLEAADLDALAGGATGLVGGLRIEAKTEGSWERPIHSGSARIARFTPPGGVPLALELNWEGEGAGRLMTDLVADTGKESVRLRSEWIREGSVLTSQLEKLQWDRADGTFLALSEPTELRLDWESPDQWPWRGLNIGKIRLIGEGRELSVQWDPPETASFEAIGIRASDFSGWLPAETSLPDVSLESVSLEVKDFEPILIAEASVRASWRPEADAPPIKARFRGRFDETGVNVTEVFAAYDGTPLLNGKLALPVTLHPWILTAAEPLDDHGETAAETPKTSDGGMPWESFVQVLSRGDLSGSISGDWSEGLRELIREWGGPDLEGADIELSVGGTVNDPRVRLSMKLHSMSLEEEWLGGDFPKIRNLEVELSVDAGKIHLNRGFLELRDSGIRLTGELPYRETLRAYRERNDLDLRKILESIRADAELQNWNASIWKDRLPFIFRPQGRITGAVGVDPGLLLRGELDVSEFALRPTLYSSPVDAIQATLRFEGRQMRLEDAGALVGGGKLSATGTVNLENWVEPRYEFKITAENVPVARTTDMILRTDADLTFAHAPGEETPLLQGELNLRNSTYLISFNPLSANVKSGPSSRPPYFSVKEMPFANWRCDLTIEGQDFLRVRSSLFTTELSASLRLTRTLGAPLLLGSVRASSGRIRFPGISMRIESLEAFIAPEEPNRLQIEADAIGQNRIYVVTMNVSGFAENPQIEFSSTPTLSNAQIILLLATGSLDGGGAGALGFYLGQALLGPGNGSDTLADRLSVEIGQEVTENGRSTVDVTYRLNDRWSVEGEYDRFDTYNLNLVRILLER